MHVTRVYNISRFRSGQILSTSDNRFAGPAWFAYIYCFNDQPEKSWILLNNHFTQSNTEFMKPRDMTPSRASLRFSHYEKSIPQSINKQIFQYSICEYVLINWLMKQESKFLIEFNWSIWKESNSIIFP